MRKTILVVIFILAAIFFATQRYAVKTGHSPDGKFNMVLVNKATGGVTKLMGK